MKPNDIKLLCAQCGKEFKPICSANCYCSNACRKLAREAQYREHTKSIGYHHKTKYNSKKREVLVTDAEQRKIDNDLFVKSAMNYESKRYKPGDPEWEKIVKTITPLDRIPKERYHFHRFHRDGCYHFVKEEG